MRLLSDCECKRNEVSFPQWFISLRCWSQLKSASYWKSRSKYKKNIKKSNQKVATSWEHVRREMRLQLFAHIIVIWTRIICHQQSNAILKINARAGAMSWYEIFHFLFCVHNPVFATSFSHIHQFQAFWTKECKEYENGNDREKL